MTRCAFICVCLVAISVSVFGQDDEPVVAADDGLEELEKNHPPLGSFTGLWEITLHEYTDPDETHPEEKYDILIGHRGSIIRAFGPMGWDELGADWLVAERNSISGEYIADWTNSEDIPRDIALKLNEQEHTVTYEATLSEDGKSMSAMHLALWATWNDDEIKKVEPLERTVTFQRLDQSQYFIHPPDPEGVVVPLSGAVGYDEPFHFVVRTSRAVSLEESPFPGVPFTLKFGEMLWFNVLTQVDDTRLRSLPIRVVRPDREYERPRPRISDGEIQIALPPGTEISAVVGLPVTQPGGDLRSAAIAAGASSITIVPEITPQIRFLAIGSSGLREVEALSVGMPVIAEVIFAEPRQEPTVEIRFRAGLDILSLEGVQMEEDPRRYRTQAFLPWWGDDGVGLPPPLPGELRVGGETDETDQ